MYSVDLQPPRWLRVPRLWTDYTVGVPLSVNNAMPHDMRTTTQLWGASNAVLSI